MACWAAQQQQQWHHPGAAPPALAVACPCPPHHATVPLLQRQRWLWQLQISWLIKTKRRWLNYRVLDELWHHLKAAEILIRHRFAHLCRLPQMCHLCQAVAIQAL